MKLTVPHNWDPWYSAWWWRGASLSQFCWGENSKQTLPPQNPGRNKLVPQHFKYRRIQEINSRWSIDRVTIVGDVLIKLMTIWVKFNLDIMKGGMIWTRRIRFQVKWFWWPTWECSNQRGHCFVYHDILSKYSCIEEAGVANQAIVSMKELKH